MKRPAFQFYPADWRKDSALQSCSIAAQGLWVNLLCIAHECDPYGHLSVNGKPMQPAQIGRLVGLSAKECQALLDELEGAGVFSREDDGTIYSRRMVNDEKLRQIRAEGGKSGAEHGNKGGAYGALGGRPKGGNKPPLPDSDSPPINPPPSSSSSSSSSSNPVKTSPPSGAKPDPVKQEIWTAGKALLAGEGMSEDRAGSYLGKLVKDYGQVLVLNAVRDAVATTPAKPSEWLQARCQERRKPQSKQAALEARNAAVAAAWTPPED